MLKRILLGISSPQFTASSVQYATDLSKRFGAAVTAMAVTDMNRLRDVGPTAVGTGTYAKDLIDDRVDRNESAIRESLRMVIEQFEQAHIPCRVIEEDGNPHEAVVRASRFNDLVVVGLRGLMEHGVAEEAPHELVKLIESGVRPILAVAATYREIRRVVIAFSGSVESARAMKSYAHSKLWPNATMRIVHFQRKGLDSTSVLSEARSYLHDHGMDVDIDVVDGRPRTELLKVADAWGADLIVVGNSAKSLWVRRVFGETALHAIRDARVALYLSQ